MFVERLREQPVGATGDDFAIVEWTAEVGTHRIAPLHVHYRDDEAWYVLEGMLGFRLGDDEVTVAPGGAVLARRGVAHTFWNAGSVPARYLLVMTPGIASLVQALHEPGADLPAVFAAHDSELVAD